MLSAVDLTTDDAIEVPAVVLGGGMAGLVAARELALAGVPPLLVEARHRTGGLVFGDPLGGVPVDLGAESYARRGTAVTALIDALGLSTCEPQGRSWIFSQADSGRAYPIPRGVLGIPASLDDHDVVAALSPAGLDRARADLTMDASVAAACTDVASFVEARLGREVLDALVRPIAGGIHSADPARLSVDVVMPGLRAQLARHGSLVRAAAAQLDAAPPGSVVASVEGGMFRLAEALEASVVDLGGDVYTRMMATRVRRDRGSWLIALDNAASPGDPALDRVPLGQPAWLRTECLVVALDGRAALRLLGEVPELAHGGWELPRGADLLSVDLALDAPALDAAPRGSGVLVAPAPPGTPPLVGCKAVTHYSVKWPWVRERGGAHVLRVSYGRAGVTTVEPPLASTLADASRLLGVELDASMVRGSIPVRFANSLPPHTPEHRARVTQLEQAASDLPGLGLTGAWLAGTGLAATIPHAQRTAARLLGHTDTTTKVTP